METEIEGCFGLKGYLSIEDTPIEKEVMVSQPFILKRKTLSSFLQKKIAIIGKMRQV